MEEIIKKIEGLIAESSLAEAVGVARLLKSKVSHQLTPAEIEILKQQGNFAEDWSRITKTEETTTESLIRVWHNYFFGLHVKVSVSRSERPISRLVRFIELWGESNGSLVCTADDRAAN